MLSKFINSNHLLTFSTETIGVKYSHIHSIYSKDPKDANILNKQTRLDLTHLMAPTKEN